MAPDWQRCHVTYNKVTEVTPWPMFIISTYLNMSACAIACIAYSLNQLDFSNTAKVIQTTEICYTVILFKC